MNATVTQQSLVVIGTDQTAVPVGASTVSQHLQQTGWQVMSVCGGSQTGSFQLADIVSYPPEQNSFVVQTPEKTAATVALLKTQIDKGKEK